jgi:hypothetical protein
MGEPPVATVQGGRGGGPVAVRVSVGNVPVRGRAGDCAVASIEDRGFGPGVLESDAGGGVQPRTGLARIGDFVAVLEQSEPLDRPQQPGEPMDERVPGRLLPRPARTTSSTTSSSTTSQSCPSGMSTPPAGDALVTSP